MAQSNNKAKYFCENCGSEVLANARFCPKCGKFFSSVRCPACGHMGTVKDFKNGCPSCHYAMTQEELYGEQGENTSDGLKHKLSRKSKKSIKNAFNTYESKNTRKSEGQDAPLWVFAAGFVFLILIIGLIFYRCN